MFEILVVVLVIAAVGALALRGRRGGGPSRRSAYMQLIKLTGGDDEQVDRLIDAERKRNPKASAGRLAQLALARWKKDMR